MGSFSEDDTGTTAGTEAGSSGADTGAGASTQAGSSGGAGTEGAQPVHGVAVEGMGSQGSAGLAAEAQAALEGAGIDSATAQALTSPDAGWKQITPAVVDVTCIVVLPQWNIGKDERGLVTESLAECLEQLFPGGLDGKYACWVKLVFAVGGIAAARAMQPGGCPPLFNAKPAPAPAAPAPAGRDPNTLTSLTPDA